MPETIGIIGAGITGLACASVLSPKYNVTIIARDLPGDLGLDWASPWAGAVFHPQKTSDKIKQEMQITAFKYYWSLAQTDPSSGVKTYPMTEYMDDSANDDTTWYKTLMPDYQPIIAANFPAGVTFGATYTTVAINPEIFLPWIHARLVAKGIKFIRGEVRSIAEARAVTKARIIVNASGLGARQLAGDESVKPVRGQTMFVKTDFERLIMREGAEYTYVIPRAGSGGVIIGGIKSDRLDAQVDHDLKGDILMRVNRLTENAFGKVDLTSVRDIVGFRPGRTDGLRVEREGDVVHAYGVAGAGYIYSLGVAEKVKNLIEEEVFRAKL